MRLARAGALAGTLLIAAIAMLACTNLGQGAMDTPVSGPKGPVEEGWKVSRVVDGDTIRVRRGGQERKVRLIGIDSPESVKPDAPVECFGPQAAQFADRLLDDQQVVLEFDPSQDDTDRYGRTLAYVWRAVPGSDQAATSPGQPSYALFNLEAIRGGFAREATYAGAYAWQQEFRQADDAARAAGVGMWGACDGR